MHVTKIKPAIALVLLLSIAGLAQASVPLAPSPDHNRGPELPSPICDLLQVPAGNRLALRAYAVGSQLYRWDGIAWVFVEPVATLFADADYHEKVAVHYLGPTWEHNNGGKVVATKLQPCTPDPTAIPWLLLQTVTNDGPNPFGAVSYIQRVNTKGGLAPTAAGHSIGQVVEVPYTAEYYFYRPRD